jgi:DNA-binding transcriptional ArsR family regulator
MAKEDPRLDQCFHALSDPTRRAIMRQLAEGEASVTALAEAHDMALPSFLGHVRVLEACGLIETRKQGRTRICRPRTDALLEAEAWIGHQRRLWEARFDQLDALAKVMEENARANDIGDA